MAIAESIGEKFRHVAAHQAPNMVNGGQLVTHQVGGLLAPLGHSVGVIAGLGVAAAANAGLVQIEFNRNKKELKEFYKDELASVLGRPEQKLKERDLYLVAGGDAARGINANRTIGEMLDKHRRKRNLGAVLAAAATLVTLAIVGLAIDARMFHAMQGPAKIIAEMAAGLITYNAVRAPLHWLGDRLFGLNRKTTHEHIVSIKNDIEAGKTITREQVFETFVAANRELAEMIRSKYGRPFGELSVTDKLGITDSIGKLIRIDEIADGVNRGQIKPAELAFAVHGQVSGVAPGDAVAAQKTGLLAAIGQALSRLTHPHEKHAETPAIANEPPGRSFAARFARADTSLGHVARLEQSRSVAAQQMPDVG